MGFVPPYPLILQPVAKTCKIRSFYFKEMEREARVELRTGGRRQLMMTVRMPRVRRSLFLEGNTCLGVRGCL